MLSVKADLVQDHPVTVTLPMSFNQTRSEEHLCALRDRNEAGPCQAATGPGLQAGTVLPVRSGAGQGGEQSGQARLPSCVHVRPPRGSGAPFFPQSQARGPSLLPGPLPPCRDGGMEDSSLLPTPSSPSHPDFSG